MTGRGREIAQVCKERNIDILCVQETKWSGKSARKLLEGYKIYYSGEGNRNGVGINKERVIKEGVIKGERVSDRLMKMKLVIAGELLNTVSAYAPQTGETDEEKEMFMENFERIIQDIPGSEKVLVGADLTAHKLKGDKIIEFQEKVREKQVTETDSAGKLAVHKKSPTGSSRRDENKIKERWREYFSNLLNVENEWDPLQDCPPVEGPLPDINEKEVEEAMKKMKSKRATGCSELTVDLLKHLGKEGIQMVTSLLQKVWDKEKMPAEWELSELATIYKRKGDPMDCGNFRGIKLLEHVMKILENVIEGRICRLVSAYDWGLGDLVYWCLRQQNIPEKLIRMVETTYRGARTTVRTKYGRTDEFTIGVGLHQGSILSPFLSIVVLDVISENFRTGLPWELLFADNLVVVADSVEELQRRWLKRQIGMERKGLKVNTKKTEVMASSRRDVEVNIIDKDNARLKQVREFKYLGVTVDARGGSQWDTRA
ncbi:uncharacterized protein LOC125025923 [Penaeus chinensis]|uniref:uncharacterized protein LOC125025923 n=1 Tax=Penaeus chinensis TaxID=139456 RepID=UPI001FB6BB73|nr:uncharacterized protein LOC125025923 [Penaeus chinensis]